LHEKHKEEKRKLSRRRKEGKRPELQIELPYQGKKGGVCRAISQQNREEMLKVKKISKE